FSRDWSSDVCSSDLGGGGVEVAEGALPGGEVDEDRGDVLVAVAVGGAVGGEGLAEEGVREGVAAAVLVEPPELVEGEADLGVARPEGAAADGQGLVEQRLHAVAATAADLFPANRHAAEDPAFPSTPAMPVVADQQA